MKSTLAVAFFAVFLAVASAKFCTDSSDCDDGQCCAGFMPFRGSCKPFTTEGKKCLINKAIFPFNEIYIVACPCAEGLECVHKEGTKNKNNGVCQAPETTAAPEVTTSGGSGEVTKDESGEVTKDGSGEVTKDEQVTKDGSGEVTKEEPEVTKEEPEVTKEEPEVTKEEPEVTKDESEVTTEGNKEVTKDDEAKEVTDGEGDSGNKDDGAEDSGDSSNATSEPSDSGSEQ